MPSELIEHLIGVVGAQDVLTGDATSRYLSDWPGYVKGEALAVVLPRSTQEVSQVVRLAAEGGVQIVPQGGNTSLSGGSVPRQGERGIVLSLERLTAIRELDREGSTAIVEAGCILATLHAEAEKIGRRFPLHLGSEGSARIGGLISTNAGGTGALRYGPMRDQVLGLEVVLANGDILSDLNGLRKDNRGYNLNHLFIGAEGSLGVITAAALKLHPTLRADAHAFVSLDSPAAALALLACVQDRFDTMVQAFELLSGSQIRSVEDNLDGISAPFDQRPDWAVIIHLGGADPTTPLQERLQDLLGSELEAGRLRDAVVAQNGQQANAFWKLRHSVTEANKRAGFMSTLDASVRVANVPAFIADATAELKAAFPQAEPMIVCHMGDGNVHFISLFRDDSVAPEVDRKALQAQVALHMASVALRNGGSFSAEHGIGRKLVPQLHEHTDPVRYATMQAIKRLLDPDNIMNPGVLFPLAGVDEQRDRSA